MQKKNASANKTKLKTALVVKSTREEMAARLAARVMEEAERNGVELWVCLNPAQSGPFLTWRDAAYMLGLRIREPKNTAHEAGAVDVIPAARPVAVAG